MIGKMPNLFIDYAKAADLMNTFFFYCQKLGNFFEKKNKTKQIQKELMRPCKIQCTFDCHRVGKIIAPLFLYVGPPPLGSK